MSEPARHERSVVPLSPAQRDHLTAALEYVERALDELERIGNPGHGRALTVERPDLPSEFATNARPDLARLRKQLRAVVRELDLPVRITSRARLAREIVDRCLIELADSGSHGLRGYGPVDPRAGMELDRLLAGFDAPLERLLARLPRPET
jgi:hypothetical protein